MGLLLKASVLLEGEVFGANDLGTPDMDIKIRAILNFLNGVTAGKADRFYADQNTLAASASASLDLAGSLLDPVGGPATFAKVNLIYVKAAAGNANDVVIGGAASNGFVTPFGAATDKIRVKPGGVLLLACDAGYLVTAGTGDLLQIANGGAGTPVTYDIVLAGRSA